MSGLVPSNKKVTLLTALITLCLTQCTAEAKLFVDCTTAKGTNGYESFRCREGCRASSCTTANDKDDLYRCLKYYLLTNCIFQVASDANVTLQPCGSSTMQWGLIDFFSEPLAHSDVSVVVAGHSGCSDLTGFELNAEEDPCIATTPIPSSSLDMSTEEIATTETPMTSSNTESLTTTTSIRLDSTASKSTTHDELLFTHLTLDNFSGKLWIGAETNCESPNLLLYLKSLHYYVYEEEHGAAAVSISFAATTILGAIVLLM
eukprot:Blabericola_migrator_1__12940@NODE_854_length_6247_cov_104_237702_g605_i0_p4_GENE_NODE_854_length_6247_cov_104_237702_g605_i0NODE_854_length_6247_cov_104_237702_g605_i0_p4_ORF_typecomplete_len261_score19_59TMEM71/PF15121_6/0_57TMEM71/PF15121_6/3_1e02_NODE_854_length_6247_cov_104_237702_g605_i054646246